MSTSIPTGQVLLSFSLGPVQPFIEAAKTTRDLWAGSYLLSWLTVAAMRPLLERVDVEFISPSVNGNPLLSAFAAAAGFTLTPPFASPPLSQDNLLPCLPNRFLARIPAEAAKTLTSDVVGGCQKEWNRIALAVYGKLKPKLDQLSPDWDVQWPSQIESVFEVRVVSLPTAERAKLTALALAGASADSTGWATEFDVVSGMLDAARSIRHVPPYSPKPGDVPQKCTLLGTYEQLGPAKLNESKDFWERVARDVDRDGRKTTKLAMAGAVVRHRERLCAVSLVKRYAWPVYLCGKLQPHNRTHDDFLQEMRFSDTATTAALMWLQEGTPLDWVKWQKKGRWSGQWLHWASPNQDQDEDICPLELWEQIQQKKATDGPPPAYYGVLMLDGDRLGKLLRNPEDPNTPDAWGVGHVRPTNISAKLAEFALREVEKIVKQFLGELVYSGGDDILALVPLAHVVGCAKQLSDRYRVAMNGATVSGGIAVIHYKEDLRFALQQARAAERLAKNAGRNSLALTVCRRSGEHASAVLTWDLVESFIRLVSLFIDPGVSDRWAYKLREVLPTLIGLPVAAVKAEVGRLLDRIEPVGSTDQMADFRAVVLKLFETKCGNSAGQINPTALTDFVTLCQSASFLARGRDR